MSELLKRIVIAQKPAVLIEDLGLFLRHQGDAINLLAPDIKGRPVRTMEQICASRSLDTLVQNGALKLYDENGIELNGLDARMATNLATLNDVETAINNMETSIPWLYRFT